MGFSEGQIRKIIELRDYLSARAEEHREAAELLEQNLGILDTVLKGSSFAKASSLAHGGGTAGGEGADPESPRKPGVGQGGTAGDGIPITDGRGGQVMARARVTPGEISIVLDGRVRVGAETPPFRSFFLDRIIGGMRRKDASDADAGAIRRDSVIDCDVSEDDSGIREIVVRNYRLKERADEIINTAGWSLARMLENAK